jgi:hypothetical protein
MQEWETEASFRAFKTFLDLPRGKRSLAEAYRVAYAKDAGTEAAPFLRDWARQNLWFDRARAWDNHLLAAEREAEVEAVKKSADSRVGAYRAMLGAGLQIIRASKLDDKLTEWQARRLLPTAISAINAAAAGLRVEMGEPESILQARIVGADGTSPVGMNVHHTGMPEQGDVNALIMNIGAVLNNATPEEREGIIASYRTIMAASTAMSERLFQAANGLDDLSDAGDFDGMLESIGLPTPQEFSPAMQEPTQAPEAGEVTQEQGGYTHGEQ